MENLALSIQSIINASVQSGQLAGAACLVWQGERELAYAQGGFADIEGKRAFSRDTICRLYSMTKPVTGAAAMLLLERGILDLSEEVSVYIPEFKNLTVCRMKDGRETVERSSRPLLIQDLLNMTSGYTYGGCDTVGQRQTSALIDRLNADVEGPNRISTQEVAASLAGIPVDFEPGTDYQYGLSADIMAAVIERAAGMRFSDFLRKNIFEPLGMNDTGFYVPQEKTGRLARTYDKSPSGEFLPFCKSHLGVQGLMKNSPVFESGGAGLCSTIDDYMRFAAALSCGGSLGGKRILMERTVRFLSEARLVPHLQQHFDWKMGHLGGYSYANLMRVCIEPGRVKFLTEKGEFGWDGWLGPFVNIDPVNKISIVFMMQRTGAGLTSTARKLKNAVYSELCGTGVLQ